MHAHALCANAGGAESVLDVPVLTVAELDLGVHFAPEVVSGQLELEAVRVPLLLLPDLKTQRAKANK